MQKQYAELLASVDFSEEDDSFYYNAVTLIERCEQFWTGNIEKLSIILDDFTSSRNCFVLEGAIFLDVKNNGHYEFSVLGNYHFLNDPFVKMRNFFAFGKNSITDYCKKYFLDAYNDTVFILKNYSEYFFFISLEVLSSKQYDENMAIGDKVYWDIISDALGKEYKSLNKLKSDYRSIDEIEHDMRPEIAKHFIFSERNDIKLSLKERIEKYCKHGQSMVSTNNQDEIQKFYISTISLIQQAVDISLNCLQYNLHPFIRFEVVYHYLVLLLCNFTNKKKIRACLLDVIISYLLSTRIVGDEIERISFVDFYAACKKGKLTDKLYNKMDKVDLGSLTLNNREILDDLLKIYHSVLNN